MTHALDGTARVGLYTQRKQVGTIVRGETSCVPQKSFEALINTLLFSHYACRARAHVPPCAFILTMHTSRLFYKLMGGIAIALDHSRQETIKETAMGYAGEVETAILQYLEKQGTMTMEEVIQHFHHLTFNQVFFAVDQLSRAGKIYLARQTSCGYAISTGGDKIRLMNHHKEGRHHESSYRAVTQEEDTGKRVKAFNE